MFLKFPGKEHESMYKKLKKEWGEMENISETSPGALFYGDNFHEFLNIVRIHTITENKVKSHLFLLIEEGKIIGGIDIRHHINHPNLIENGGHIGYGIAPKFRRKGYATYMLKLGLIEAKKLGLKKVLLTCDTSNIGSNKVIKSNGGIFERLTQDGTKKRYWISL